MRLERRPAYLTTLAIIAALLVLTAATTFWRVRDYADKSIDTQVLLKTLGIMVSLAIPAAAILAGRLRVNHRVQLVWLAFLGTLMLTSVYAPNPGLSLMYAAAFIGCFLFAIWLTDLLGETTVATILVGLVGLVATISLIVYFVNPELGRMHAWLGEEFGNNARIRGIAGSPNGLGSMTAVALIFAMLYFRDASRQQRGIMVVAAPFALACLLMSDNRSGMMMLALAPVAMAARHGNRAFNLLLIALVGFALLTVLVLAPDLVLGSVSRTGEVGEVTSANGRSIIWSVVLEKIGQEPLFGYGYAAATSILPLDPRLFSVAAHAHNLFLEILFSGGVMAFALFLAALAVTFFDGLRHHCFEPLLVICLFLLRGMTEPAPFGGAPSFAGYAFFIAVAFVAARAIRGAAGGRARLQGGAQRAVDLCQRNLRQAR